jgi:hypothetical protein
MRARSRSRRVGQETSLRDEQGNHEEAATVSRGAVHPACRDDGILLQTRFQSEDGWSCLEPLPPLPSCFRPRRRASPQKKIVVRLRFDSNKHKTTTTKTSKILNIRQPLTSLDLRFPTHKNKTQQHIHTQTASTRTCTRIKSIYRSKADQTFEHWRFQIRLFLCSDSLSVAILCCHHIFYVKKKILSLMFPFRDVICYQPPLPLPLLSA